MGNAKVKPKNALLLPYQKRWVEDSSRLKLAVKSRQISELKQLVQCIDPNAFMIVQPAHQVLGEGFKRYSDDI